MTANCRFAIISDPHVGVSETISNEPHRFHLIEVSIPALESIFTHLEQANLDFLLIPGDLTQDGEKLNHIWLQQRLAKLPFPTYVIPGNHDILYPEATATEIGLSDFPHYYQKFGYSNLDQLYYAQEILPGLHVIGLNSTQFTPKGQQLGCVDSKQLLWLETVLSQLQGQMVMVMIHHNVIEHLPGQATHELGKRYMLDNAASLKTILYKYGVKLVFTGHLHVQDIVQEKGLTEITTGSIVSYPHPYRIIDMEYSHNHATKLSISSYRVQEVPGWENLQSTSREWMAAKSERFMLKLLTGNPLNLPIEVAMPIVPNLRYFWADVASGDVLFDFSYLPSPMGNFLEKFGAIHATGHPNLIDNHISLLLY